MATPEHLRPSPRPLTVGAALGAAAVVLHASGPAVPVGAGWSPSEAASWVEAAGPVAAATTVLRLVLLVVTWWSLAALVVGSIACRLRLRRLHALVARMSAPPIRRVLHAAARPALAAAIAGPALIPATTWSAATAAADAPPPAGTATAPAAEPHHEPLLVLLDPPPVAETEVPALVLLEPPPTGEVPTGPDSTPPVAPDPPPPSPTTALEGRGPDPATGPAQIPIDRSAQPEAHRTGPEPAPAGPAPAPARTAPASDDGHPAPSGGWTTWHVEPGQHLWSVADALVRAGHPAATELAVARYHARLVEANRQQLPRPDDPDLVLPGTVLRCPPLRELPSTV